MNITIQTNNQNNNHFFMGPWGFVTRVIVMSLAAVLAAAILPGIHFDGRIGTVIVTAVVIALLNNFIRPILIVVALPVLLFSMGLFMLVINTLIILLAGELVPNFQVDNFWSAFWFSLLLTFFNYLLELPNKALRHSNHYQSPDNNDNSNDNEFTPYEEVE